MSTRSLKQFPLAAFWMSVSAEDKLFLLALIVSSCIHFATCASLFLTKNRPAPKPFKTIEVTYQAASPSVQEAPPRLQEDHQFQEKKITQSPQILEKKEIGPAALMKDLVKSPSQLKLYRKQPSRLNLMDTKRHVSVPVLESEKIMNPRYINYNERIREKIRNRAHSYVDNPDFEIGEVYLTFILLADGSLKDVKILDEKTKANQYLRNISLRSIKESVPFPVFPGDLKYPELTFSIVISFEDK